MSAKHDDGLAAKMATLLKTPVPTLRKRLAAAGQDPAGLSRDALVRALAGGGTPATTTPTVTATPAPTKPPKPRAPRATKARDPRLPKVGSVLQRRFKGKPYEVVVEHDGFRYAGKHWRSLTAIAKEITGYPAISGPLFWGIAGEAKALAEPAAKPAPEPAKVPAKRKAGRPVTKQRGG